MPNLPKFHVVVWVGKTDASPAWRPGKGVRTLAHFIVAIALTALGAAVLHSLEAAAWGILYIWVGAMPDGPTSMLYSLSAITSYGHSNIFLENRWRLLGGISRHSLAYSRITRLRSCAINEAAES